MEEKITEENLFRDAGELYENIYDLISLSMDFEELNFEELKNCYNSIREAAISNDINISKFECQCIDKDFELLSDYKTHDFGFVFYHLADITEALPDDNFLNARVAFLNYRMHELKDILLQISRQIETLGAYCSILFKEEYQKLSEPLFESLGCPFWSHDLLEQIISIGETFPFLRPEP